MFLSFSKNLCNKYGKKLLNTYTKTGLDALKTFFQKLVHKTAEPAGEVTGNKIPNKITKPKPMLI